MDDLPEKVFIHNECLRANDITFEYQNHRKDPNNTMWVAIAEFFLCKLN